MIIVILKTNSTSRVPQKYELKFFEEKYHFLPEKEGGRREGEKGGRGEGREVQREEKG
jgi:hypothetical protein